MQRWLEKRPEVRDFRKEEAAWLAGVIDGEGSVGLYDYGREGRRVIIQISNTSEPFVVKVRQIIGCGSNINRTNIHISHKGRKPMYMYSLKGSLRCYWVLRQIFPYLIIKKEKAERIIKELERAPFGRWVNATEEYKKFHSEQAKKSWQNPLVRSRRIEGLRKFYASKK